MKPEWSEQNLARRCSQRDKAAEEQLYRTYAARVYSLCRRYLGNEEDAKDLMLETLVQALDKIGAYKYTGEGSLYAWISRIAINKSINQIKRHRWRFVPLDHEAQDRLPEPTEDFAESSIHYFPLKLGLSVRIPLAKNLYISTGVDYSLYRSTFTFTLSGEKEQYAHYLGIPVRLDWVFMWNPN